MKKCRFCAEDIQEVAIVCKHCGRDLVFQAAKESLTPPRKRMGRLRVAGLVAASVFALVFIGRV